MNVFFRYTPDYKAVGRCVYVCVCVCVCILVTAVHACVLDDSLWLEWKILSHVLFFCVSRWAGNKAWQKMRRGWWLVRWMGTGMAILSLLTHSWGQDTEGKSSQPWGEPPQASPPSLNCGSSAKRELVMWKRGGGMFLCTVRRPACWKSLCTTV